MRPSVFLEIRKVPDTVNRVILGAGVVPIALGVRTNSKLTLLDVDQFLIFLYLVASKWWCFAGAWIGLA